jgi:hypothetical protein|tara:strand:- start:292 stop:474 length:183 start_codon:yes stop_codon:yes gene_type:complete
MGDALPVVGKSVKQIDAGASSDKYALYNAVGIRFHELPITPEKVLKVLKEKEEADSMSKS